MTRALFAILLFGCGGSDEPTEIEPTDSDSDPPTTDPETTPPMLSGGCAVQTDNVLRYDCVFTLPEAGPLEVVLDGGGRNQVFSSAGVSDRQELTLFLMKSETHYTWTATAGASLIHGEFTTAILPPEVDFSATITGVGTVDSVVVPFQCGAPGHLLSIDERGQVEWYQNMTKSLGLGLDGIANVGFDATSESLIGLLGHIAIAEYDWTGALLGSAIVDQDYALPTHHSVFRRGSRRYVLNVDQFNEPDGTYLLDGIYVFDSDWTVLGEWSLRDVVVPSGGGPMGGYWAGDFPGTIDYSHGNGIYVDENLDWTISMRGIHTVIKVRGDLASPDFGTVMWALTTSAFSPFTSDYLVASSNGATLQMNFSDQHHAHFEDDGGLWIFDNGSFGDDSRAIRMNLLEDYAVADIDEVFELPVLCAVQSSVYRLPNGHALLTCATNQTLYEFDGVSADPIWALTLSCNQAATSPLMVRGQPVFW